MVALPEGVLQDMRFVCFFNPWKPLPCIRPKSGLENKGRTYITSSVILRRRLPWKNKADYLNNMRTWMYRNDLGSKWLCSSLAGSCSIYPQHCPSSFLPTETDTKRFIVWSLDRSKQEINALTRQNSYSSSPWRVCGFTKTDPSQVSRHKTNKAGLKLDHLS